MDSEEDIYDANDVESDDYYSDDMMDDDDDYDCGGGDDDGQNHDDCIPGYGFIDASGAESYTVLKERDIRQRLEDDVTEVSTVLSIPRDAASILLRHYDWSISRLHDEWFADEEAVRKTVGLADRPVIQLSHGKITCRICFDSFPSDSLISAGCGHLFCSSCWSDYIRISINEGTQCLMLRCPDPSCPVALGGDLIDMFVSDEEKEKYARYLARSYVEGSKRMKWCPAPGCECAVDFAAGGGSSDVSCLCSYSFCWNCTEEVHRPVDCATVSKWTLKNRDEAENTNWILVYTKPCPKCKRPIEKNNGCMRMMCTAPCGFEFCWLCLDAWSVHGYRTCSGYKMDDKEEMRKEMAKSSLEKYAHYYERWASNQSSRQKALADLQQMQITDLEKLSDIQGTPESQLKFITNAWLQIIECRRVLKWTYAYGYYLPVQEHTKRRLFEYLQGEAETGLERLHQCVEKELKQFLSADGPSKKFGEFRGKLVGLTRVTKNYFENLVRALENGLADVDAEGACSVAAASSKKDTHAK